jgi:hypothetical protein
MKTANHITRLKPEYRQFKDRAITEGVDSNGPYVSFKDTINQRFRPAGRGNTFEEQVVDLFTNTINIRG